MWKWIAQSVPATTSHANEIGIRRDFHFSTHRSMARTDAVSCRCPHVTDETETSAFNLDAQGVASGLAGICYRRKHRP